MKIIIKKIIVAQIANAANDILFIFKMSWNLSYDKYLEL